MIDDYTLAAELVTAAGRLAAELRSDGLQVAEKTSISDVVSNADTAAEALVVRRLLTERPDDGVIGEEGAVAPGQRVWLIDPVDGTYNFVSGLPTWCSAVALRDGSELILGAVYQPSTAELWVGGVDQPTTCNGVPVPRVVDAHLGEVSLSTYLHPPRMGDPTVMQPTMRVFAEAATVRMLGSGSVELAMVASGRLGVWAQPSTEPWDWLPGAALVQAAGGSAVVVEHLGQRWHVAGPPTAVREAITALTS